MSARVLQFSAILSLAGCAGTPVVIATPNSCATLAPPEWEKGVAGVEMPGLDAEVGELWAALDGQTGRLDQANGHYRDQAGIQRRCEARDAAAVRKATRGWFGRLFN